MPGARSAAGGAPVRSPAGFKKSMGKILDFENLGSVSWTENITKVAHCNDSSLGICRSESVRSTKDFYLVPRSYHTSSKLISFATVTRKIACIFFNLEN